MVGRCVVPGCNNSGHHKIPNQKNLRTLWIEAMKIDITHLKIKRPLVCPLHFKETDYNYLDLNPEHVKRRYLKKHAVPSIFEWNEEPQNELCKFTFQEEISHSLSDSDPEIGNEELSDPLLKSTDDGSSITEKLSSQISRSSSDIENDFHLNISGANKTYTLQNLPVQFIPELPGCWIDNTAELSIGDPLAHTPLQACERQDSTFDLTNYLSEFDIDIANNVEIIGSVDVEQSTDNIEIKQEVNSSDVLENSITLKNSCLSCGQLPFYSVHSYKKWPNGVHFYTGLESFEKLMFVYYSLGDNLNNLNYFYGQPPSHLDSLEQFCMTLFILRRHREFEDMSMMYQISIKQVTNIFITWIRFMALQWRTIDLWINREAVSYYMPFDFSDKYPNTRVIIDATECPIKKPHLPTTQQVTFSTYKNTNTVKLLIGIAPSGLISYISPCYGGSASDRQIIEKSSILNKFDYNDEIMVDKGLNVQDIFLSYGVKVNMPTFFRKGNQINSTTLTRDRKIASKRVHVERVIGMLKTYKILKQPMNQTEVALSSDIAFVIAMLVNFRSNIINKSA